MNHLSWLFLVLAYIPLPSVSAAEPTPTFLALGDSYTIGEGVAAEQRWPVQLTAAIRARGTPVADPYIIARTGWTTRELLAAIAAKQPLGPFTLVTLQIGVNDQFRGLGETAYRDAFEEALVQAIALAGGRAAGVVVLSIPDYGVTPFASGRDRASIAAEIDRFNAIGRASTITHGAAYVDITAASRSTPEACVADGLHPSGEQYARWVALSLASAAAVCAQPLPSK